MIFLWNNAVFRREQGVTNPLRERINTPEFSQATQGNATYGDFSIEIWGKQTKNKTSATVPLSQQHQVCALICNRWICFEYNTPDSQNIKQIFSLIL